MELYGRSAARNGSWQNLNAGWAPETGLEEPMSRSGLWGREAYPERPGAPDCVYYLRTGSCGYGAKCRYNHPRDRASVAGSVPLRRAEYPERVGEPECQYYLRTGTCKFGATCKFHHPRNAGGSLINVQLNTYGYPLRLGEKECSYYLKTGQCKFGITCKFHHPQSAGVSTPVTARPFYPTVQSPSAPPEQFGAASTSYRFPRPPLLTSSYLPGAYGAVLLHTGVVPIPNWSPYTGAVNHAFSPGAQAAVGATSLYGVSSASGVSGSFPPFPSSSSPLGSKQKEHQFPERPGEPECQYYMKNGDCKYGPSCKYHHPPDWVVTKTYSFLSPLGLPLRPGMQSCSFYLRKGHCKFGRNCKFDHPMGALEYSPSVSSLTEIPIASYMLSSSATTMVATVSFPEVQAEFISEAKLGATITKDQSYGNRRDYALISGEMWLQALKWHSVSKITAKDGQSVSAAEEDMSDVYPLQLRLSVLRETSSLGVKIMKKENSVECFKRAVKIFTVDSETIRIWDFSGQSALYWFNDQNKTTKDFERQSDQDVLLELQVYGLSDPVRNRGPQHPNGTSIGLNVSAGNMSSNFFRSNSNASLGSSGEAGILGLTGLQNLGNTCFMNSSLQCLAHTPKMVDYFLGDYKREINHDNPLGMNGEIASAFGDLLKKLWAPGATPVAPRTFKSKLAHFAPQFSGFNQHDSQELLAFLLDGLHEDLNRVKCKPYVEVKDDDNRPDNEVADEYWRNHLARNDSIIVDVCQGQYRSTLVCPVCSKVSVTFDPFMYLSLPLPSTSMRTMTLTVVTTDGSAEPSPYTIHVSKNGKLDDLIKALSTACCLRGDETLLVAEIFNNRIIRFLEESANTLSLIRDEDRLVAYRVPKDVKEVPLVMFTHQQMEEHYYSGVRNEVWRPFGIPLVTYSKFSNGSDIHDLYLKLMSPFLMTNENAVDKSDSLTNLVTEEKKEPEDATTSRSNGYEANADAEEAEACSDSGFLFYVANEKGSAEGVEILMDEPVSFVSLPGKLNVIVRWPDRMVAESNTRLLCSLPEVFKLGFSIKRPQESVSLYKCLEAFLKEEPLGPEDMWYCPVCKKHCQASKKLDLWRLPEVLVIHLKRFSYSRFWKNKLETYVDFPIHDLDLSTYIAHKEGQTSHRYMLYAISNHYGSMGGGHYTAFVHHGGGQWYDFDDSHVSPISEDKIKSSAAYVLFYRRVEEA